MNGGWSAAAVFERAVSVELLPADLTLFSLDWAIYFAVDGRHSVAQIGAGLGVPPVERDAAVARLVGLGLLTERPLSAGEYLRAVASVGGEARTLGEFLTAGLGSLLGEPVATAASPALSPEPAPAPDLILDEFEPLPLPEPETDMMNLSPQPPLSLSLRAVMRFVVDQARDADAGQLDVYRAFVRLDPQLLKRNGITTLRFEEDRLLTDPDLKNALLQSVEHVVGRSCPPEVFVHA